MIMNYIKIVTLTIVFAVVSFHVSASPTSLIKRLPHKTPVVTPKPPPVNTTPVTKSAPAPKYTPKITPKFNPKSIPSTTKTNPLDLQNGFDKTNFSKGKKFVTSESTKKANKTIQEVKSPPKVASTPLDTSKSNDAIERLKRVDTKDLSIKGKRDLGFSKRDAQSKAAVANGQQKKIETQTKRDQLDLQNKKITKTKKLEKKKDKPKTIENQNTEKKAFVEQNRVKQENIKKKKAQDTRIAEEKNTKKSLNDKKKLVEKRRGNDKAIAEQNKTKQGVITKEKENKKAVAKKKNTEKQLNNGKKLEKNKQTEKKRLAKKKADEETLEKKKADSAKRTDNASRLRTQLAFEEAGILKRGGDGLTNEAIAKARKITISGGQLTNPKVIKELTKDGSSITDWGKFRTNSVQLSSGQRAQIHFYKNKKNGDVNQNIDFKVSGIIQ